MQSKQTDHSAAPYGGKGGTQRRPRRGNPGGWGSRGVFCFYHNGKLAARWAEQGKSGEIPAQARCCNARQAVQGDEPAIAHQGEKGDG